MFYISLLLEDNFLMNYVFRIVTSNVPVHGILFVPPTGIFHEDKATLNFVSVMQIWKKSLNIRKQKIFHNKIQFQSHW